MSKTLKIKRGNKASLPMLAEGELGLTLDEKKVYVGTGSENIALANDTDTTFPISNNWIKQSNETGMSKIAYTNGMYLALNPTTGKILYSLDGNSFSNATKEELKNTAALCGGKGKFIAVFNDSNTYKVSTNLLDWTTHTLPSALNIQTLKYIDDRFILLSNALPFYYSYDGETWITGNLPCANSWYDIAYGNGLYIAVGYDRYITSTDGIKWTEHMNPSFYTSTRMDAIYYGNGVFVACATVQTTIPLAFAIITSTNGIDWKINHLTDANNYAHKGCFGDGIFMIVGNIPYNRGRWTIFTSADGTNWSNTIYDNQSLQAYASLYGVIYGNNAFLISAEEGVYTCPIVNVKSALQTFYSTANPVILTGSYTGNGSSSNFINLGFAPKAVIISPTSCYQPAPSTMLRYGLETYTILTSGGSRIKIGAIDANGFGFTVYGSAPATNQSGTEYTYIAFR